MSDNRRKFTRVLFHIHAELEGLGEKIEGRVTDISLKGLFVETAGTVEIGEEMDVTLTMPFTVPPIEFRCRASAVRLASEGIGLEIVESDLQSFTHLKNIVAMHIGDPDKVLEEFMRKE